MQTAHLYMVFSCMCALRDNDSTQTVKVWVLLRHCAANKQRDGMSKVEPSRNLSYGVRQKFYSDAECHRILRGKKWGKQDMLYLQVVFFII